MFHTPTRGVTLTAVSSVLILLTACSGYGTGGSASSVSNASSARSAAPFAARSSSSGPRFANFLSSSSKSVSSPPFFSMKRSSRSASVKATVAKTSSAPGAVAGGSSSVSVAPAEAVKLFIETDRTEAHTGDTIYYTVTVKNMTIVPLKNFPVSFSFSPEQLNVLQADGAIYPDHVEWTVDSLQAGQKRGLRLAAQIGATLQGGTAIRGTALSTLNGATSTYQAPEVYVITDMPATGAGGFTGPVEDTTRILKPL